MARVLNDQMAALADYRALHGDHPSARSRPTWAAHQEEMVGGRQSVKNQTLYWQFH